jgi:hypothetical protein
MLQVFHLDVARVDLDVAYIYACCKRMFQVFHTYVESIFIWMLHVLQWLQTCFPGVSNVCCKCFNYFGCMLQVFHLDVAKVDLGVARVVVGPICSSHLLHCWARLHVLGVEGAPGAGTGHEAWTGHGAGAGHGAVQALT